MNKLTELRMKGEKLALQRLEFAHSGDDDHSFRRMTTTCSDR
jgi:hypothetical protein